MDTMLVRRVTAGVLVLGMMVAGAHPVAASRGASGGPGATHGVVAPSRATGALGPLLNIPQTWNNCGPASVAEALAYWGVQRTQYQVQLVLRADNSPYGMASFGVPAYARSVGLRAMVGVEGTPALLKALISNGFPVIVNQLVSLSYPIRHYRPIEAYDDGRQVFVSSDPYMGAGYTITYADFTQIWAVSNNRFMVIYPPAREPLLTAVLAAAGWDRTRAYAHDLARTQARMQDPAAAVKWPGFLYYAYLNLAWDQMELGHADAARLALRQAAAHGASPITIGWISAEIAAH